MKKIDWDSIYMTMAYLIAMKSKDLSTHVGAVIIGSNNEVRSVGFNGMPIGINDDMLERQNKPEKYYWMEHAERNAIFLSNSLVRGCRMYTNGIPCADCARAIIQAGIVEVIVDKVWDDNNVDIWKESAERTKVMFSEAGVKLRFWEGDFLDIHRFRRGEKL
jgi:dCMP deaminase